MKDSMRRLVFILIFLPLGLWSQEEGAEQPVEPPKVKLAEKQILRKGNDLFKEKRFVDAEVKYKKALQKNPYYETAGYNLGNAVYEQQRYEEALDTWLDVRAYPILDEDGKLVKVIEHLRDRGIGVLITDHNVRETLGICSRAYILSDGSLIASGSPEDILANQHHLAAHSRFSSGFGRQLVETDVRVRETIAMKGTHDGG